MHGRRSADRHHRLHCSSWRRPWWSPRVSASASRWKPSARGCRV